MDGASIFADLPNFFRFIFSVLACICSYFLTEGLYSE
jgi:hypothetical protein